jgi:hypothetical protein
MIMALTDFVVGVGAPVVPSAPAPATAPVVVVVGGGIIRVGAPVVHVVVIVVGGSLPYLFLSKKNDFYC